MPFDFGNSFGSIAKYACGNGVLYHLTSNPIYLALLLTALVMITIIALIGEQTEDSLDKKDFLRLGVYILIVTCIVISMHHYTYIKAIMSQQSNNGINKIYNTINEVSNNSSMTQYPIPIGRAEDVSAGFTIPNGSEFTSGGNEFVSDSLDIIEDVQLDL